MAKNLEQRMKVIEKKVKVLTRKQNQLLLHVDLVKRGESIEPELLLARVKDLEEHLRSLDWNSDGNGNHPDDGGWFD